MGWFVRGGRLRRGGCEGGWGYGGDVRKRGGGDVESVECIGSLLWGSIRNEEWTS